MISRTITILAFSVSLFAAAGTSRSILSASDHADPIIVRFLGRPDSNLTGLFAFESKDKLVIALCARPGLAENLVDLKPLSFDIHIDFDSEVQFYDDPNADEGRTFRYGGWVTRPDKISEDFTFRFKFDQLKTNPFDKVKFGDSIALQPEITSPFANEKSSERMTDFNNSIRSWVGLRDDPFILQGFSTTNVVAMIVEIPLEKFGEKRDLLIWGTSSKYGNQIDHVGRSLRTMLPRFDFLNQLHPKEHVAAIKKQHESPGVSQDLMRFVAGPIFGIRHYDFEPDVMFFSHSRWQTQLKNQDVKHEDVRINDHELVAFPNGRRPSDDVAALMCERGDCLLFEVSTAEAHADEVIRPTKNGSPFLEEFPYLAPPNENPMPQEMPSLRFQTKLILGLIVVGGLLFVLLPWWLYLRTKKKLRRVQKEIDSLRTA